MIDSIIDTIEVKNLYKRFTYRLPAKGTLSSAAILYGDNGVGKSTILRLVFHLLSAATNRGHRTALRKIDFEMLSVTLANGTRFTAERKSDDGRDLAELPIALRIEQGGQLLAEWLYVDERYASSFYGGLDTDILLHESLSLPEGWLLNDVRRLPTSAKRKLNTLLRQKEADPDAAKRGQQPYISALASCAPTVFYVNAERRLDSDAVADPSDELELRRAISGNEPKRINDLVARARDIALSQAMLAASRWVQRRAVQSANRGSTNVHSVYISVLEHLSNDYTDRSLSVTPEEVGTLIKNLKYIEMRTSQFEEYEIANALDMSAFTTSLAAKNGQPRELSVELIKPYIQSVISRIDAQENTYQILDRFVKNINSFLTGKRISYKLTQGFYIESGSSRLEPSHLSSGEKQLILMYCYALTAGDRPSVFMIDEPEISLNVKWQRQLIQSLMEITSGSSIQFIMASHSIELISQHRNRVVKLENLL